MNENLATPVVRLVATLIDSVVFVVPFIFFLIPNESVRMVLFGLCLFGMMAAQFYWLTVDGQTIGKKMMAIRIVKVTTGQNGGFVPNVLLRGILNGFIGLVPFYSLVDLLFIFRADRRCVHDMIAGTKVIAD